MPVEAAHRSYWQTADVVFGIPVVLALMLHWLVPFALPYGAVGPAVILAGSVLSLAGVALIILARRELARRGQPADPGRPTSMLVTTGIFAYSRNPLYLGVVCVVVGVALAVNLPWMLAMLLPSLVACRYVLIAPEERYLSALFGATYRVYAATVRRWIGRAWR